jgi:hypothetical protein
MAVSRRLGPDNANIVPLAPVVFKGWRQNMGMELVDGLDAGFVRDKLSYEDMMKRLFAASLWLLLPAAVMAQTDDRTITITGGKLM